MIEVLAMKVSWYTGYSNLPELQMLLKEPPPRPDPPAWWHSIRVDKGTYYVCRLIPTVRFLFESDSGGGALGRTLLLADGSEHKTNGGWSSNEGAINRYRALDERFAEILPYDVVDITYYGEYARAGTYNDGWGLGMAGLCFDLPWAQEQVAKHLPGVELYDLTDRNPQNKTEDQASAEQGAIFGAHGYSYIPVPIDRDGTTRESIKPDPDSELFQRTAMSFDKTRALQEKERRAKKGA